MCSLPSPVVLLLFCVVLLLLLAAVVVVDAKFPDPFAFKLSFWKSFEKSPSKSFWESLAGRWGGVGAVVEVGPASGGWNCT